MAGYIGRIAEFVSTQERWDIYIECVNNFFLANDIVEEGKMRAALLTSMGREAYTTLRNLTAPKTPAETAWKEILRLLRDYYAPKVNPIVERCKFYQRTRQQGESAASFLAELRAMADKCEFGDQLATALRDRLVSGIGDDRMQRRLLSEPYKDLILDRAFDICQAMETAANNVHRLQQTTLQPAAAVNAVSSSQKPQLKQQKGKTGSGKCMRCGDSTHHSNDCRFREATCNFCGKTGHLKKVCFAAQKQQVARGSSNISGSGDFRGRTVHNVDEAPDCLPETDNYVFTIKPDHGDPVAADADGVSVPPLTTCVEVNRKLINFEVDTGCGVTIISSATEQRLWPDGCQLMPVDKPLRTYSGQLLDVKGRVTVSARYGTRCKRLPLWHWA